MEFPVVDNSGAPVVGDQLNRDERIRLEALAQAVSLNIGCAVSDEHVVAVAQRFERWIKEGKG